MKIITAMDSFKGSLSSNDLNELISSKIHDELIDVDVIKIPISDGGEGFLNSLSSLNEYNKRTIKVNGPLHYKVDTEYLISNDKKVAIIESANIIGLSMVEELLPFEASSYGIGQVINDAIKNGAKEINIGLGGSATNDAGIGLLKALDYQFYDADNEIIDVNIHNLHKIYRISTQTVNPSLRAIKFKAITDVKNIFTGNNGATQVFGKQKGLTDKERLYVDSQIDSFRQIILNKYEINLNHIEGTGAAGGISGIMLAFLNSDIESGIDYVLDNSDFNKYCETADYVITGEGRIDNQTFYGKVIQGIVNRAELYNVPVIAIGGSVEIETLQKVHPLPIIFSIINTPLSLVEAMDIKTTKINLNFTVKNICNLISHKSSS